MIHSDEIYYIPTYMVNPKVKEYTYNLIKYLKSQNKEIILVSHHPIPTDFQELVDYCIYDKRNTLLYDNEYKGYLSWDNSTFTVYSQEFFSYSSIIACYYFYSALFLAKFLGKRIVHSIDYDTIIDNLDQYEENYEILTTTDYSSIRYKNDKNVLFADTYSTDISKLNLDFFIKSEEELKGLANVYRRFEEFHECYMFPQEKVYWKTFDDIKKSVNPGLEHIDSPDRICLAVDVDTNHLILTFILEGCFDKKTFKVIADDKIISKTLCNNWWLLDVTSYKNITIFDSENKLLKYYPISELDIEKQKSISQIFFKKDESPNI